MRKLLLPCALLTGALIYAACGVDGETPAPAATPIPQETPVAQETPAPNGGPTANGQDVSSDIVNSRLEDLQINVGITVTWTNQDALPHTVTAGTPGSPSGEFDSGNLRRGESHSFTFDQPGEFAYFCVIHPAMIATVIVTNGDGAATGAGAPQTEPTPAQAAPTVAPFTPDLSDDYDDDDYY